MQENKNTENSNSSNQNSSNSNNSNSNNSNNSNPSSNTNSNSQNQNKFNNKNKNYNNSNSNNPNNKNYQNNRNFDRNVENRNNDNRNNENRNNENRNNENRNTENSNIENKSNENRNNNQRNNDPRNRNNRPQNNENRNNRDNYRDNNRENNRDNNKNIADNEANNKENTNIVNPTTENKTTENKTQIVSEKNEKATQESVVSENQEVIAETITGGKVEKPRFSKFDKKQHYEAIEQNYRANISEELLKKIETKTDSISLSENKTYFIERSQLSEKSQRVLNGPRFIAVKILNRYDRSDSYVDVLLNHELNKVELSNLDKSLLTEIVNGVIRWRARLDWVLNGFYHGEFQKCLNLVKNAMRVGLYQMLFLNKIPHPAAIDDSVEIVKHIQGDRAAGLVNGVLRNIARNIANIRYPNQTDDYPHYLGIIHSHPKWLTKRWLERFGNDDAIKLLEINNKIPNIPLRINSTNYTKQELIDLFTEKSIPFSEVENFENILWLEQNINVAQSELFKNGRITIQDPSASLIPLLCAPKENHLVVDLCSAPGGKTVYLAELMKNKGKIIAIDKFANRLKMVNDTAARMGFTNIETKEADSREFRLENKQFADVVLVDAPCSGLGTLKKKPEIKWKREVEDIYDMAKVQYEILQNASKLLKVGGALVYSTCTIEPEENVNIIKKFLENNKNFVIDDAKKYVNEVYVKDGFIQTFPHLHNIDGAFGARLIRKQS